jgi:hypothetical protein
LIDVSSLKNFSSLRRSVWPGESSQKPVLGKNADFQNGFSPKIWVSLGADFQNLEVLSLGYNPIKKLAWDL